jgi:AbrB family looped-hinge helix DNA binding protein
MEHGNHKPEFFGSTTMGERGQIVIPAEAREKLDLKKGEKLLVMGVHGETLMLVKFNTFEKLSDKLARRQEEIKKILEES